MTRHRAAGRRTAICRSCGQPWSIYATNHAHGCGARWLIARGDRELAQRRHRLANPAALRALADELDGTAKSVLRVGVLATVRRFPTPSRGQRLVEAACAKLVELRLVDELSQRTLRGRELAALLALEARGGEPCR